MPDAQATQTDDELGPIDFVAVEFPDAKISRGGFDALLDLADRGVIRVLDLEFVATTADGTVERVSVADLPVDGDLDLSAWAGASSGLLDDADLAEIGASSAPGSVVVVVVFENRWVLGLVDRWRQDGARLIADGGIPADDLVAALDATETD